MAFSSDFLKRVEIKQKTFVNDPIPFLIEFDHPINLRQLARQLNILPLLLDMGGCYALSLTGEVVSFSWDEPDKLRLETNEMVCNIALFQGSKRYPDLEFLVPSRPSQVIVCKWCKGTGVMAGLPKELSDKAICGCGGLGWQVC
jgi:hypothetical protein